MIETEPPADAPVRRRGREATSKTLLEAGMTVFSRRGYDAATTREVAEAAGVNEQLIQRYFGGKAGLLVAILDQLMTFGHGVSSLPPTATLEDELASILRFSLERRRDFADLMRVSMYRAIVDPEVEARMRAMHENRRQAIAARLQVHAAGAPAGRAEAMGALLNSLAFGWGVTEQLIFRIPGGEIEARIPLMVGLLARMMRAPARG